MIFSEIYGAYFHAVAKILSSAVSSPISDSDIRSIVEHYAFSESILAIEPALRQERWQLISANGKTAIKHKPSMPLTTLQKSWLKAISLDPRIKLFDCSFAWLKNVEPLFTPEDYLIFDQYGDGDPFDDEKYIRNFKLILNAIKHRYALCIGVTNRNGHVNHLRVMPEHLEYSEKDDKFRLIAKGTRHAVTVNLGRIVYCKRYDGAFFAQSARSRKTHRSLTLELADRRNTLERVMLHFSHFEKEVERLDDQRYRVRIVYDKDDETEIVIRVLSFGPFVKVTQPHCFVAHIKDRLMRQKSCAL